MIDYLRIQKIIHWLMSILIMLDLVIAQKFGGDMELWDRLESRVDHATAGMIVAFLFILRIILRYRYGAPSLPSTMPVWQTYMAKAGHYGLYFLMGLLIISGITTANFTTDPIVVFGLINLSSEVNNVEMFNLIRGVHEFATNAIIALISIHILAAIYHRLKKDGVWNSMVPFFKEK